MSTLEETPKVPILTNPSANCLHYRLPYNSCVLISGLKELLEFFPSTHQIADDFVYINPKIKSAPPSASLQLITKVLSLNLLPGLKPKFGYPQISLI